MPHLTRQRVNCKNKKNKSIPPECETRSRQRDSDFIIPEFNESDNTVVMNSRREKKN